MKLAGIYVLTAGLFLAILVSLGTQSKTVGKLSGILLLIVGVLGTSLYGYGYYKLSDNLFYAVMRTLFSVFCMFLGRNEISAISAVPELKTPLMQCLIYFTHLTALYLTASAVIASLGSRLIRTLRMSLSRKKELHLIYGANDESVQFGREVLQKDNAMAVFVDAGKETAFDDAVFKMGSLLISAPDAKDPNAAFLKKIGVKPGKRRLHVYCLHASASANLGYAEKMRKALESAGVDPDQTSLTALLESEALGSSLQNTAQKYGFGSVIALERHELVSRLAMKECPPYKTMTFDENGKAKEDFEALVVGFGQTGQEMLRSLIENGQFFGSEFRAIVIDENYEHRAGYFFEHHPGIRDHYAIRFVAENARSMDVYKNVMRSIRHLNYCVVCTGNEKANEEIAAELSSHFRYQGIDAPVLECTSKGIRIRSIKDGNVAYTGVMGAEILCNDKIDRLAMIINHSYHKNEGRTAKEDWEKCDYFSRASCRASADYADAFLYAAGTTREEVLKNGWDPSPELIGNLSQTEHLRWCAFHYAMGYDTMPEDVFRNRGEQYLREVKETGKSSVRIAKDTTARFHACLIPWEELDKLSEREQAYTGKYTDYKIMDEQNVRALSSLVKEAR